MTFEELLEKYQALLLENGSLKEEIENLNTKLGVSEHRAIHDGRSDNVFVDSLFPTPNTCIQSCIRRQNFPIKHKQHVRSQGQNRVIYVTL